MAALIGFRKRHSTHKEKTCRIENSQTYFHIRPNSCHDSGLLFRGINFVFIPQIGVMDYASDGWFHRFPFLNQLRVTRKDNLKTHVLMTVFGVPDIAGPHEGRTCHPLVHHIHRVIVA